MNETGLVLVDSLAAMDYEPSDIHSMANPGHDTAVVSGSASDFSSEQIVPNEQLSEDWPVEDDPENLHTQGSANESSQPDLLLSNFLTPPAKEAVAEVASVCLELQKAHGTEIKDEEFWKGLVENRHEVLRLIRKLSRALVTQKDVRETKAHLKILSDQFKMTFKDAQSAEVAMMSQLAQIIREMEQEHHEAWTFDLVKLCDTRHSEDQEASRVVVYCVSAMNDT